MRQQTKTRQVALCALLCAFTLIVLYAAAMLPNFQFGLTAAAGLFPAAAVISAGGAAGVLTYAAAGVLAVLLLPDKFCGILFLLCFGLYPILKHWVERLDRLALEWILKITICEGILSLFWFAFREIMLLNIPVMKETAWLYYLAGTAAFVIYDVGMSKLLAFYQVRVDRILQKP